MIEKLTWYEKENKNDKSTSLGYGARFDPVFKGLKIYPQRDVVYCVYDVPWWMSDENTPEPLEYLIKNILMKKYHTVPNYVMSRKKKPSKSKTKRGVKHANKR